MGAGVDIDIGDYEMECIKILTVKGLQFAKSTDFLRLIVESDNQTIINHFFSPSINNSYQEMMYENCPQLVSCFKSISYSFVWHSENYVTHNLVGLTQLNSLSFLIYWLENIHCYIFFICK